MLKKLIVYFITGALINFPLMMMGYVPSLENTLWLALLLIIVNVGNLIADAQDD